MTKEVSHIHNIRSAVMMTLAVYANAHDDVTDGAMVGALAACLCDALLIRGQEFNEEVIDVIRKTYEVCEIQHAMRDKENNSVQ